MAAMEKLGQIQQTLNEIDKQIPDALRAAFGLGHRVSRTSDDDGVASFVASLMQPPAREHGDDRPAESDDGPRALRMDWASCYVQRHDEDSHFGHDEAGVVGVADGVGGHRKYGVDAGAFSRGLMTSAFAEVVAIEPGTPVCPYTLLERAYEQTVASGAPGASTAVILSLAGKALKWAYIGDSAFAVLRDGKIVHRSQRQQRRFNCPFQLNARGDGDSISEAEVGEMPVRHGDVVVIGTDGLFDNMFDAELERVVRMGTTLCFSSKNTADIIAGIACEMSESKVKDSPYSIDSRKQRGDQRHGGKTDDITVVVVFVVSSDS